MTSASTAAAAATREGDDDAGGDRASAWRETAATAAPPMPTPSAMPSTSARFSEAEAQPSRPGGRPAAS